MISLLFDKTPQIFFNENTIFHNNNCTKSLYILYYFIGAFYARFSRFIYKTIYNLSIHISQRCVKRILNYSTRVVFNRIVQVSENISFENVSKLDINTIKTHRKTSWLTGVVIVFLSCTAVFSRTLQLRYLQFWIIVN